MFTLRKQFLANSFRSNKPNRITFSGAECGDQLEVTVKGIPMINVQLLLLFMGRVESGQCPFINHSPVDIGFYSLGNSLVMTK